MFEVIPPAEMPKVIDAAQTGRCVACYADAQGNGFYCTRCDPPIQVIADLMEYGAPLQLTTGEGVYPVCGDGTCPCNWPDNPCSCKGKLSTRIYGGPFGLAIMSRSSSRVVIDPDCPHHGDRPW
jgi:hypothetical protein